MFALSARFSQRSDLFEGEPKDRGEVFAKKARFLYDYARQAKDGDVPSLKYLQGSILLVYYQLSSGPSFRGLLGTGVCCRMAYALSLHKIDAELESTSAYPDNVLYAEEWVNKEERRRAWWAVWELDTFASTLSCQPFVIDIYRIDVLLPVSDKDWFNCKPVPSALLASKEPLEVWRSLKDSPNQNEYAWYLVSNCLMRWTHETFEKRETSLQTLESLLSAINCFSLSLPSTCRLSPANMIFNDANFPGKNWIIATHLMVQRYTYLAHI